MTTTTDPWPDRLREAGIEIITNQYMSGYVSYQVVVDGEKRGTWRSFSKALTFAQDIWAGLVADEQIGELTCC